MKSNIPDSLLIMIIITIKQFHADFIALPNNFVANKITSKKMHWKLVVDN